MTPLPYASQILSAKIGLIPVIYKDKRPDHRLLPPDGAGKPTWEPFKTTLPSHEDLKRWFRTPHNYGVVAGWQGLMVLDFDEATEYSRWQFWATQQGGIAKFAAQNAFQVTTSRGVHVYLRCKNTEPNRKARKIDIKFKGYVLGPGSVHPAGAEYRAIRDVLIFPVISSLSDILPAELLEHSELPQNMKRPMLLANDPWKAAMEKSRPLKAGVVEKIKMILRIEEFFTDLKPTSRDGRWQIAKCPFHDDANPSFWIDTQQQICGCFSGCTAKPIDVIGLYARLYGLANGESIRVLARMV
ncbi:MAG: bifunctional DNA primase/polymerase [Chloroflexota bacterium]